MGKKAGKRLNKKQMSAMLEDFFRANPGKSISFKEIFRKLHFDTHPMKMLAIEIMEEMAWDDFLKSTSISSYRLNESAFISFCYLISS